MTSINRISSEDIRTNQVAFGLVLPEYIRLMSAGVRSKHLVAVDVVCVCSTSPRVIGRKSQRVKVLSDGDHGREAIISGEPRRRLKRLCALESRFDDLTGQAKWMRWLDMEAARNRGDN